MRRPSEEIVVLMFVLAACGRDDTACPAGTRSMPPEDIIARMDPNRRFRFCELPDETWHGPVVAIGEHGEERVIGRVVHDKKQGRWIVPDAAFAWEVEAFYVDDRLEGRWVMRDHGRLRTEAHFRHNVRHGTYRTWGEQGQPLQRGTYDLGKKIGTWTFHHDDGRVSTERRYGPDGVLLAIDGRDVLPPPDEVELPDGRKLVRSRCVEIEEQDPATFGDGVRRCLDVFEQIQECRADYRCRHQALASWAAHNPP